MDAGAALPHPRAMSDLISRDELRELVDAGTVTVVEALGAPYFASGHLPGAINIPHLEVEALAPALLPDKDAEIVVYCGSPT